MEKRGQQTMGMPFGVIFAIFLIVVFIVVAFIAIRSFLSISDESKIGLFYEDLQNDVNGVLRGDLSEFSFKIDLPSKIERICVANLSGKITNPGEDYDSIEMYEVYEANVFLLPTEFAGNMEWKKIERLDVSKITEAENPYCVDVDDGLIIKKGIRDRAVVLERGG